jgi:hypothetical protein
MKIYPKWRFHFWHLLFRTGHQGLSNPLEAIGADKMNTGYSVCWSKLIKHTDVLDTVLAANPKLGDTVFFGKVGLFKKVVIKKNCNEGSFKGEHVVRFVLKHSPEECNYSHTEILIKHNYYENGQKRSKILQYKDWSTSLFKTGKPPLFYKELRAAYRAKTLTILSNKLNNQNLPRSLKFHPKIFFVKFLIYINLR